MKTSLTLLTTAAFLLGGCAATDRAVAYLGKEVGHDQTFTDFGVATANNAAVISGDLTSTMMANLTRKFANDVPARVNFEFNSARLDAEAKAVLRQQADWIKRHDQVVFRVYGHTDKVGSDAYNQRLGKRRADAVVNFLVSQGIPRKRVHAVASFGETRPVVLTEERSRENRRTVTEVSGFARRTKDGQLDGRYAQTVYQLYISEPYVAPTTTSNL